VSGRTMIAVLVAVLALASTAGCGDSTEDSGCSNAEAPVRVPLTPSGNPAPDVSALSMCTNEQRSEIVLANSSDDVWLVRPSIPVDVTQFGGVPTRVQIFRALRTGGTVPGTFLEPGTAVRVALAPEAVSLAIDPAIQSQWSTFTLLGETVSVAREQLPELIRNEKYRAAFSSCLSAGATMADTGAAARYDTDTLIQYLGLTTGTTQCASNLILAEQERQALAMQRTGHTATELRLATFAEEARSMATELDDLLKVIGRAAHI
jgi:hypothetical protein